MLHACCMHAKMHCPLRSCMMHKHPLAQHKSYAQVQRCMKYRNLSDLHARSKSYIWLLVFMVTRLISKQTKCYLYQCSSRGHQTLMRAPIAACFKMAI